MLELRVVLRKDCAGGEKIVDMELPRGVTEADLDRLRGVRSRQVLTSFPVPLFRVDCEGRFLLSGVLNDKRVRFTVRRNAAERSDVIAIAGARELLGEEDAV